MNRGLFAFFMMAFISCKHTEKTVAVKPIEAPAPYLSELASNQARITGKVVSIDEMREAEGACSKAPCNAKIKVQALIKQGSLFDKSGLQDTTAVYFAFTLAASNEELFPGMKTSYPGLKINERFEATIESRPAINEAGLRYLIYEYKKLTYEK